MCEALRQRRPEMLRRVIVASGDASLARHRASLDDLGVAVIEKPFRADRLAAAARDVVRRADEAAPRTPAEGVKAVRAAGTPAAAAPGGG
jgi:DNA-binding response OmpR family regulator